MYIKLQHIQQQGVTFDGKLRAGYDLNYTYGSKPHQIDNIKDENYRTEANNAKKLKKTENVYEYDLNGNLIFVSKNKSKDEKQNERKLLWDEENRLEAVSDNGYVSLYTYDAGGERVAKLSGNGESVYVNSKNAGKRTQTNRYTAYISPYFVLSSGGEYTKHIMIGSQRIVSKLGDVGSFGQDPRRIEYAGTTESIKVDYKTKYKKSQQIFRDRYKRLDVVYNGKDNDDYRGGDSFCCGKQKDGFGKKGARPSKGAKGGITNSDKPELFQYYYHPDHLGSSSYITNLDGDIAQHIEYVPFGEVFINEQNNRWNTPYLFNSKELDEETGLYYYGARYYNPRTSQWASIDPKWEKYLGRSPYEYTLNNPIKYTDPNGMEVIIGKDKEGKQTVSKETQNNILADLKEQTGITTLKFNKEGKLTYNEKGKIDGGSETARNHVIEAIKSTERIYELSEKIGEGSSIQINTGKSKSMAENNGKLYQHFDININSEQINGFITSSRVWSDNEINSKTLGFGMTLMHEISHYPGSGGFRPDENEDGEIGSNLIFMNSIRQELDNTKLFSKPFGSRVEYYNEKMRGTTFEYKFNGKKKSVTF